MQNLNPWYSVIFCSSVSLCKLALESSSLLSPGAFAATMSARCVEKRVRFFIAEVWTSSPRTWIHSGSWLPPCFFDDQYNCWELFGLLNLTILGYIGIWEEKQLGLPLVIGTWLQNPFSLWCLSCKKPVDVDLLQVGKGNGLTFNYMNTFDYMICMVIQLPFTQRYSNRPRWGAPYLGSSSLRWGWGPRNGTSWWKLQMFGYNMWEMYMKTTQKCDENSSMFRRFRSGEVHR